MYLAIPLAFVDLSLPVSREVPLSKALKLALPSPWRSSDLSPEMEGSGLEYSLLHPVHASWRASSEASCKRRGAMRSVLHSVVGP
jgi:hypothetical protein